MFTKSSGDRENQSSILGRQSVRPLFILLCIALVIRLIGLGERSYFNDELSALYRLQADNFKDLIENGVRPDYHPAGIEVFMYYWNNIAGDHPFLVRLPFALAGVFSIWLLFILGNRWFGQSTAWFAASSLALLQFPLIYSQLARPYSTGLLFVLLAAIFWDKTLFSTHISNRSRLWYAAAMGSAFALAMYNHYFSFFMVGLMGVTGLFFLKRNTALIYIFAGAFAVLLFMPHLSISIEQLSRGGLSTWLPPPGRSWLQEHIRYLFNNSWWLTGFFALIAIPLIIKPSNGDRSNPNHRKFLLISLLWYLLPLLFAFGYSRYINPIFQNSIMLFGFPFLLIALFSGYRDDKSHLSKILIVLLPLILLIHLLTAANYYRKIHFTDFRSVAETICESHANNPKLAWAVDVNNPWYIHHYLDKECNIDSAVFYAMNNRDKLSELYEILNTLTAQEFIYSWLRPADPVTVSLIRRHFPHLVYYKSYNDYGEVFRFGRQQGEDLVGLYQKDSLLLMRLESGIDSAQFSISEEFYPVYHDIIPIDKSEGPFLIHSNLKGIPESDPGEIHIVIATQKPDGSDLSWDGLRLELMRNADGQYFFTALLPAEFSNLHLLNVYLWNPNQEFFPFEEIELWVIKERDIFRK